MKRMLLAATILAAMALSQPSMATEECYTEHNLTAIETTNALIEQAMANFEKSPTDQNLELVNHYAAILERIIEFYKQCDKIIAAGEPT